MKEKEIIKKSNDIFQILLKKYISKKKEEFKENLFTILNADDENINLIEINLECKNFALSETLLYFFEEKAIYLFK